MKILWIAMAAVLMVACNTQPKTDAAQAEENSIAADAQWVEVTLKVAGMTCEGCENAINTGVKGLEGIASVESSHEEACTKVKYDSNTTSVEEITASITETGFKVKGEI
ncbi:MAG: heavy-metal-associated domain-containing protein [Bacteroidetes bacterium]|nr:heavy-metal-associated domain-containing protein [Bacteroidota bacterium]